LLDNDGVRFYLNQHRGIDQTRDLYHAGGGPNVAKKLPMRATVFFPSRDVRNVHSRADYICHCRARADESSLDVL